MANHNNFKSIKGGRPSAAGNQKKNIAMMIQNTELEAKLEANKTDKSVKALEELVELLRRSTVLIPAQMDENKRVSVGMIKNDKGQTLIAVYTAQKHLPKDRVLGNIMALPYPVVNNLIVNLMKQSEINAVVFNPFTQNVAFLPKLLEKIEAAEQAQKESSTHVRVSLGDEKPQTQITVHNEEVEKLALKFKETEDNKEKTDILNQVLTKLHNADVVLALGQDANGKDAPELLVKKENGEMRLPIYTNPQLSLRGAANKKVAVTKFEKAVEICMKMDAEKVKGITIVAPEVNLNIERPLMQRIVEIGEKLNNGEIKVQPKTASAQPAKNMDPAQAAAMKEAQAILNNMPQMKLAQGKQLTEAERAIVEHQKFALQFLPDRLKEQGQTLIDDLCNRKETAVDELFEESYYDTLMYPYLEEEFQVLAIGAGENKEVIRIDLPERDQSIGSAIRVYIVWDSAAGTGRYFAIARSFKDIIVEELVDGKPILKGSAPTEGTELQTILKLAEE